MPLLPSKWRIPLESGLQRARLLSSLDDPWSQGIVLLTAPAGSGKTTLLAQVAAAAGVPVAWYTLESSEREVAPMLRYLEASLRSALPDLSGEFGSIEGVAATLEREGRKVLLVLDDLQTVDGSPSEEALGRLFKFPPRCLGVLAASRTSPGFNTSRLRLGGSLREVDGEALRFRAWEVERLFSEVYGDPLGPEDLARLARRTNGWAAGLHLFHLATRGRSPDERRRKLETLGGSSRIVREYLTDNVLSELPAGLRRFLVDTCVLGRLSSPICDRLLESSGSEQQLQELENRQLFLAGNDDEGYRCHDVLRSHLEAVLIQERGEAEARSLYKRAAVLLEAAGSPADALYAYTRAEEWEAAARLLDSDGAVLAGSPAPWIDLIPASLSAQDPWLLLGAARRERRAGRWQKAIDLYTRAESAFDIQAGMDTCRRERAALNRWVARPLELLTGWDGLVRLATINLLTPQPEIRGGSGHRLVARGLRALIEGNVREAREMLEAGALHPEASDMLALGARLAGEIARLLQGEDGDHRRLEAIIEQAHSLDALWLASMARAALALTDRNDGAQEAADVRVYLIGQDDPWGAALAGLLESIGALRRGSDPGPVIEGAAAGFKALGAAALEAWCRCVHSVLLARRPDVPHRDLLEAALKAEAIARSAGLVGPVCCAYESLAVAQPERAVEHAALAAEIRRRSGLRLSRPVGAQVEDTVEAPPLTIKCFGEFEVTVRGAKVDLRSIKPRSRQLFRLLAMHLPDSVHREVIGDALWPGHGSDVVRRNLQVAVHSVRRLLGGVAGNPLVRNGDSYSLELPGGSIVDIREFEHRLAEGRQARSRKDFESASRAFESALDLYSGDLFAEDGPAEWVVMERERCRAGAVEAAESLGDLNLQAGGFDAAVEVCERGLRLDRYRDSLWRKLIAAHVGAGNRAAAGRTRGLYAAMLAELGLADKPAI